MDGFPGGRSNARESLTTKSVEGVGFYAVFTDGWVRVRNC